MFRRIKRVEKIRVYEDRSCNKCGKEISTDPGVFLADQSKTAQELLIYLKQKKCVHLGDYCPECLEPIWTAISELIRADPRHDFED